MRRLSVYFLFGSLYAGVIPGRFIVELSTEPVAAHVAHMGRRGLQSTQAAEHRARIRAEQHTARTALARQHATVLESVDTVANALMVQVPDAQAARLSRIPGVVRVRPERIFHKVLDHALPLHKVPDAWNLVGIGNAGAGVKIAFIDTGIDNTHPGFQDPSLPMPDGFPRVNAGSDLAFTSNKVIVARSYSSLWPNRDPDYSARDHSGHGTSTAMAAAGVTNTGPLATITGVAPKAWLGSYKVFGTPGYNDGASESSILKAIDDAVADGMDVINLSLGSDLAPLPAGDPEVLWVSRAVALGVIVVVAAGNNGPDPATVASPANAPDAISVGASNNDRVFASWATVGGAGPYAAIPGSGPTPPNPVTASLADVAVLDGSGLACAPLPPGSLGGQVALILRGVCTFEQKLDNAQQAGAVGALIYSDAARPDPPHMAVGAATLPAEALSYQDGIAIKQNLAGAVTATLDFAIHPNYVSPDQLAPFSAKGPNLDGSIKPDLVAVGTNVYTAAESYDPNGDLYDPSGYSTVDGTSYSTPLVAGAAALVKAARPGLTALQYKSLLVNNAGPIGLVPGTPATTQQAGAGILDVSAALRSTAALSPVSLSFGAGGPDVQTFASLTITNVGAATETYQLSAVPRSGSPAPLLPMSSVTLDPGASTTLGLTFTASRLSPGQYEGYVSVLGTASGVESRAPYWYGVPSGIPQYITVVDSASSPRSGTLVSDAVVFHVTDASGLLLDNVTPLVTAAPDPGAVIGVLPRTSLSPGAYGLNVRLVHGVNTFHIQAGDISKDVILIAR